jgi:4-amino-4-deoxy-L-arabinose transferase-like glycosyltransferase
MLTHDLMPNAFLSDQRFYHGEANTLAGTVGYVDPLRFVATHGDVRIPTALKPPLYPLLMALESRFGGDTILAHRLLTVALGGLTIIALALLARRLGGARVAIATAVLVALSPQLWITNAQILSETLYGLLLVGALLVAYEVYERPTLRRAAALGALLGLATLTRPEGLIVGVLVTVVISWRWRRVALRPIAVGVALFLVTLAPWAIRNWIKFDRPVPISTQSGANIAGANCHATYYGRDVGNWQRTCFRRRRRGENEAEWIAAVRPGGIDYALDHAGRFPVVALARIGRTWGFYHPYDSVAGDRHPFGNLPPRSAWVLLALAVPGALIARRRRVPLAVLLVLPAVVTITAVAQFGLLRYRFTADLALLVLAGFTIDYVLGRKRTLRSTQTAVKPSRQVMFFPSR